MTNHISIQEHLEGLEKDKKIRPQLIELYYKQQMTLQSIGGLYGISKERIRQWMDRMNLKRRKTGWTLNPKVKYRSLNEYFQYVKKTGKENFSILAKFVLPLKKQCEACGSISRKLFIHHLKYPALSLRDIKILCRPCHSDSHGRNGTVFQRKICNEYLHGKEVIQLAKKYKVSHIWIYKILKKWHIKKRNPRKINRPEVHAEICSKYQAGRSGYKLAYDYGVSDASIYRVLWLHNVEMRNRGHSRVHS